MRLTVNIAFLSSTFHQSQVIIDHKSLATIDHPLQTGVSGTRISFVVEKADHTTTTHMLTCTCHTHTTLTNTPHSQIVKCIHLKCIFALIDVFHGAWLHFQRAIVGFLVYHSWCEIQASKRYVESLPLVLKKKKSCFSQGERLAVQLPLDRALALRK